MVFVFSFWLMLLIESNHIMSCVIIGDTMERLLDVVIAKFAVAHFDLALDVSNVMVGIRQ